jgi:hypothetical protein
MIHIAMTLWQLLIIADAGWDMNMISTKPIGATSITEIQVSWAA